MLLKAELHSHTSDDPHDSIPHTATELIDRAAELGYGVLAITLHDHPFDVGPIREYASQRGIVLIPGLERTVEGRHVLLLNFSDRAGAVNTFDDVARLKAAEPAGLVIAPHPFFLLSLCLGSLIDRHASLFDAVEINAMYVRRVDFNARARAWAAAHGKPLVGNGDVHRLAQLGTTYSLIDAEAHPESICDAIRAGRVEVRTTPLRVSQALALSADILAASIIRRVRHTALHPETPSKA
ncbi:MAG TPA: PHP-associated domain-containing protein [Vicinamibacterales bacterium]|nr:PHP-associated domain-containing protein [Vicinamibacterales bacterium]